MKNNIFLAVLLAVCGHYGQAAEAPSDPQIGSLPDRIEYSKVFTYPAPQVDAAATPEEKALLDFRAQFPRVAKLEVTKAGDIRKEQQSFTNGTKKELWKAGDFGYIVDPAAPERIMVISPQMNEESETLLTGNGAIFQELSWVKRETFQGEAPRKGVNCDVYKSGDKQVWVDQTSRLPVYFESPEMQISYAYKPSDVALQLPERFLKKREEVERAWRGQR